MYVFPSAVESDGYGFNLLGGRSYFSLVLSSVSSPPGYPNVGNKLLFINVPLFTTEEFFLILVLGLFFTVNDNFKLSPGYKDFFNLYTSKLYKVSSKTRSVSLSNLKVLIASLWFKNKLSITLDVLFTVI